MNSRVLTLRTMNGRAGWSRLRQVVNVVLAVGQLVAIGWNISTGAGLDPSVRDGFASPVFPAAYTFAVWLVIYPGALVYAVYQALPGQRQNVLLEKVGWWTAAAFAGLTLWAVFQAAGWLWLTVVCIFAMFAALLQTFIVLTKYGQPLSPAERTLVVLPLSIFFGYITAATVLTIALVIPRLDPTGTLDQHQTVWAVAVLAVAGAFASWLTAWSRGNIGYGLTIMWSFVGIAVQNIVFSPNFPAAVAAGTMALLVVGILLQQRFATPHLRK